MSKILAIDIGGTKVSAAFVDENGETASHFLAPTVRNSDDDLGRTLEDVCAHYVPEIMERFSLTAVVVGVPEYVSPHGEITSSEVLSWSKQPCNVVSEMMGIPARICRVVSDVKAGAMGEKYFGAAVSLNSFLYVSLGTGLSSTLVLNEEIWPGVGGRAIGFGEILVETDKGVLSLEAFTSGRGIERRLISAGFTDVSTTRDLDILAASGNKEAQSFLMEAATKLAAALHGVVCLTDPGKVIIGGGLGASAGYYMGAVRQEYERLQEESSVIASLISASLGADSALLGCAAYAFL